MKKSIVLTEVTSGQRHRIDLPCTLGRGKEADLRFADTTISHTHALITGEDDRAWIEDLGSVNGVFVNGKRINGRTELTAGDELQLGQVHVILEDAGNDITEQTVIVHAIDRRSEAVLDHQRLRVIYEITAELTGNQDIPVLGRSIFSRLKEIFSQDRGYIALFGEDGSLHPLLVDPPSQKIPLSTSITKRVFSCGDSLLLEDALGDMSLSVQESIMELKIRCALCVPLIYNEQIYGLMYLDRSIPGAYTQADLVFLKGIASIVAPLLENARLWTDLKGHYNNAVDSLKKTEARLIETERSAAYVRLAQAMAHELRNPLMVLGGMVRKLARTVPEQEHGEEYDAILSSVERIEQVLTEVDDFVKIPFPDKRLHRIDQLLSDVIDECGEEFKKKDIKPCIDVDTSNVTIPLDAHLVKKAFSMVIKEMLFTHHQGKAMPIALRDHGKYVDAIFGASDPNQQFCALYEAEMVSKPWSMSLFLGVAHKIISDHGGTILLDPNAQRACPVIVRIPRMG